MKEQYYINNYLNSYQTILKNMALGMISQQIINNISNDFIICMIPHHEGAIAMCQNLLKYSDNIELRQLATNIIKTQQQEITQMLTIQKTLNNYNNTEYDVNNYMNKYYQIINKMFYQMHKDLLLPSINLCFINEMIPHHQGAIDICQNLLQYKINPTLAKLAQKIIIGQKNNIYTLQQIRSKIIQR